MTYSQILTGLAIDVVAITVLSFAIYYRRYRRPEMLVAFTALNLGVFAAVALLASSRAGLALGFGLFGILSIVRLRSSTLSQSEVGYYFIALTLGLVNSLGYAHLAVAVTLTLVMLGAMFVLDAVSSALVRPGDADDAPSRTITLDRVHEDEAGLRAELERRLGAELLSCDVLEIDYVRDVTVCSVRCRTPRGAERSGGAERSQRPVTMGS